MANLKSLIFGKDSQQCCRCFLVGMILDIRQ